MSGPGPAARAADRLLRAAGPAVALGGAAALAALLAAVAADAGGSLSRSWPPGPWRSTRRGTG